MQPITHHSTQNTACHLSHPQDWRSKDTHLPKSGGVAETSDTESKVRMEHTTHAPAPRLGRFKDGPSKLPVRFNVRLVLLSLPMSPERGGVGRMGVGDFS
jgi:hypothetical protein